MFRKFLYLLIALPGLFLLVNNYPYFMILSVLLTAFFSFLFFILKREITSFHFDIIAVLLIIYLYITLSYFFSNQNLQNFLSYNFLRNDGSFFFCYLPFIILAVPYFDYEIVSKLYFKFIFFTFFVFALFGFYSFMTGNYIKALFLFDVDIRGPMFVAFNFAHNAAGSVYAVVSLIALAFFLKEKSRDKFIYLFVFLVCIFGLFITKSRGSYLGFAAGLVAILWFYFNSFKKFIITIAILSASFIAVIYFTGLFREILYLFSLEGPNVDIRLTLWRKAWFLFSKSPLFGIGFGRYNDVNNFINVKITGIPGLIAGYLEPFYDFSTAHAHNSYLHFLSEVGVVGLGLLIFFWVTCFVKLLRAYRDTTNDYSRQVFLSCLGIIVCLFVLSFTENYFSAPTVILCISTVVSLGIGLYWQEKTNFLNDLNANIKFQYY